MAKKTASKGANGGVGAAVAAAAKSQRSWSSALLFWGLIVPAAAIAFAFLAPVAYRYTSLEVGQPFSVITNRTTLHMPGNHHSRFRGPEYVEQYDRFFFQWWNFLVYDAETHDHWTIVYHTTKYSKAAQFDNYASTSLVHKKGPADVLSAHEAIPLANLEHTKDWDLAMRRSDGSIPHRTTMIDDDTYNVVGDMNPAESTSHELVRWNLTFHRVHGMYGGLQQEDMNRDHCSIVSTLFGYHSKVSGWIQEGDKRWEFGNTGAAGDRYRAYAAGSWGCKLPEGYPTIQYPWTWIWLVIPGDAAASPPRPEIGMAMGTARFQTNVTAMGDLYGGFASVGVGSDIVTATFADLHHKTPFEVPFTRASTDDYLKVYDLGYGNWTEITDPAGSFNVPLVQTYDVETSHHRFQLTFHTRPEQYFRLPVVVEHLATEADPRRLAVFSDFRACGVRTHVQVWHRSKTPAQLAKEGTIVPASGGSFAEGGWETVIYDGEVSSLNAIEFAYQAPLTDHVYDQFAATQKLH